MSYTFHSMTCPNCGNSENFLVKTLQMHGRRRSPDKTSALRQSSFRLGKVALGEDAQHTQRQVSTRSENEGALRNSRRSEALVDQLARGRAEVRRQSTSPPPLKRTHSLTRTLTHSLTPSLTQYLSLSLTLSLSLFYPEASRNHIVCAPDGTQQTAPEWSRHSAAATQNASAGACGAHPQR